MKSRFILCGAISSAVVFLAVPSNAVTLNVLGGTGAPLPFGYDLAELTPGIGPGTSVQHSASLLLDEPGLVTFSYSGSEANDQNQFWANGALLFDNKASTILRLLRH